MSVILAIESSCDETSAAVIKDGVLLSNIVATQQIHELYGGVVPELASREHQKNIIPVVQAALLQANISKQALNAVAFTLGPGLLGALLIGHSFAKSLALALRIPLIAIDHIQAHVLAHFIDAPKPQFPYICLTVSGGHTQIILVKDYLKMEIVGETQDDAVGEAFDKTAKLLGLPYPGGALIDKYAQNGNPHAFEFPEPAIEGLNFSFSGIKTAFLYFLQKKKAENPDFIAQNLPDICASVQHTLIKILLAKLKRAAKQYNVKEIGIAGGVSANSGLRKALVELGAKNNWNVYIPDFQYCTDNAGMVAIAAHYKYLADDFVTQKSTPAPRLRFDK
jgi:N6-L-threonylcarbamoyladenine synthase